MTQTQIMKDNLEDYLRFSQVERGLSPNTIVSYRTDLEEYLSYLEDQNETSWEVDYLVVDAFLATQKDKGKATTSISRMISSLRKFYQWLLRQDIIERDPLVKIDSPKSERRLPTALSEEEVTKLLDAPDTNTGLGIRDRAMLEVLYATGMRVSELINLRTGDIHSELKIIRVLGKGSKERLVPITEVALSWLEKYQKDVRENQILKSGQFTDVIFLNNHGHQLTRQAVWQKIKKYCQLIGLVVNL